MKVLACLGLKSALIFMIVVFSGHEILASEVAEDPLQDLQQSFPDSVHVNVSGQQSVEFCPDNTCEYFVAGKGISLETLKDFAYLYIFFFSDYFALDEWRNREGSMSNAKKILSKPNYQRCKQNQEAMARCILRKLAEKNQINLYFIRYDEGKRNLVPEDVFARTAKSRLRRPQKQ